MQRIGEVLMRYFRFFFLVGGLSLWIQYAFDTAQLSAYLPRFRDH